MPEFDLLIHQRTHQHQRVLLMHQSVRRAVYQHQIATLNIASLHGQIGLLQSAQVIALQRYVTFGEK